MHTDLYSLSKIFTENLFRIPDYQRGYSWTTRQLKDFWTDLVLLDAKHDHYTGVLTLEEVTQRDSQRWTDDLWILESKRYSPFYVVDGQQRLTTSLILVETLIEQLKTNEELNYMTADDIKKKYIFESKDKGISRSYIFGYERDNPSYEFLKTRIFLEPSDNHEIGELTIYTKNLMAAKEYFASKLKDMTIPDLARVFAKLTQHFLFNIYTIASGIEVFVAFETMNNRGKPLSHLELLKNRLIFLSTRLGTDPTERTKVRSVVNEAWETAYHYLGRNQKRPLDDDRFLSIHFTLYFGRSLYDDKARETSLAKLNALFQENKYKTYLPDDIFTSRNIPRTTDDATKTLGLDEEEERGVNPPLSTESLYAYARDLKSCVQVYYRILNPHDSEFSDEQKVVLTQINRLEWYEALPLGLAAALNAKSPDFTELLTMLEHYLFIRLLLSYPYSRGRVGIDLVEMALRLTKGLLTIKGIGSELRSKMEKESPNITISEGFGEPFGPRGYYGWRGIRYFLFEYEQELKRKARTKRDKVTWDDFVSENYEEDYRTVEHVYPQRPSGDYWKKRFELSFRTSRVDFLRFSGTT
jgi:hypothetical protein